MSTELCKCYFCGKNLIRKKAPSIKSKLHFCNSRCKAEHQRAAKPVSRAWLVEHYIDKRLDTTQIGHLVNRDPKSVWNWLRDFGIPTRSRGSGSSPTCFKKGNRSAFAGKKHTAATRKKLSDIAKASGRVPFDPKVGSYMNGKRGAQTPNWKGGITPERQAFYSSSEWKSVAKMVWKRDNATCQRCRRMNKGKERFVFDIHHIAGFEVVELRAVLSNLVLLCEKCHYWVHSNANANSEFLA